MDVVDPLLIEIKTSTVETLSRQGTIPDPLPLEKSPGKVLFKTMVMRKKTLPPIITVCKILTRQKRQERHSL